MVLTLSDTNASQPVRLGWGLQSLPPVAAGIALRWYAAYTSANHEKRIAEQLRISEMEHFLPLYRSERHWKDRTVSLELPLFPGYIFVRMALSDRLRVLRVPGVARLIGFNGTPASLTDGEIESLKKGLGFGKHVEPHPFLCIGRRVRVKSGPLGGIEGILVRRKSRARFVIAAQLIQRAMSLEVEEASLEPLPK